MNRYADVDVTELISKKDAKYREFESFKAPLSLTEQEDLEFYLNQIESRRERLNRAKALYQATSKSFPEAENIDINRELHNQAIFTDIKSYLKVEPEEEVSFESELESLPYVVKITKAPASLLSKKVNEEKNEESPEPISIVNDNSFFQEDLTDQFTESIENASISDEESAKEEKANSFVNQSKASTDEVVSSEQEKDAPIIYPMDDGDSLISIALVACGDENGWYDIYEANREKIEQRLNENGLTNKDPFEVDTTVLSGLELVIPNEYRNIKQKENESYRLAA